MGSLLLWFLLSFSCCCSWVDGVTPTGEMKIKGHKQHLLVAPASFSESLPSNEYYASYYRLLEPSGDSNGCEPTITKLAKNIQFYLLVSRGTCTFQEKQIAAYGLGAKGIVVYNSLEGIYQGNNYASSLDYDCDNGSGYVDHVTSPVYSSEMDAMMPTSCTADSRCASGKCVVTNMTDTSLGTKVCCAWDLYITMGTDSTDSSSLQVDIPSVFMRMEDAAYLQGVPELAKATLDMMLYQRSLYFEYLSIILLYLVAVATVFYGSYKVAKNERKQFNDAELQQQLEKDREAANGLNCASAAASRSTSARADIIPDDEESNDGMCETNPLLSGADSMPSSSSSEQASLLTYSSFSDGSSGLSGRERKHRRTAPSADEDTFNISAGHTVLFVVVSSTFLVLLYLVDLTLVVTVLYLLLAAFSITAVCYFPVVRSLARCYLAVRTGVKTPHDYHKYSSLSEPSVTNAPYVVALACALLTVSCWFYYR